MSLAQQPQHVVAWRHLFRKVEILMNKRKVPVEVAGYVDHWVLVVDIFNRDFCCRWMSVVNENYSIEDVSPWSGDSRPDDCPF